MVPAGATVTVALGLTQCWHRVPGGTATSILDLARALERTGSVRVVGVGPRSSRPARPEAPPGELRHLSLGLPFLYDAWTWTRSASGTSRPRRGRPVHVQAS